MDLEELVKVSLGFVAEGIGFLFTIVFLGYMTIGGSLSNLIRIFAEAICG